MTLNRKSISDRKDWCTPVKYKIALRDFFVDGIDLDPCSNNFSIIRSTVSISLPNDGLSIEWDYKSIFVNPPYGKDRLRGTSIADWIRKCYESNSKYSSQVVALIPVATNTRYWKSYIWGKSSICFLSDTRLKFMIDGVESKKGAPMACAMVYWGGNHFGFRNVFKDYGFVVMK